MPDQKITLPLPPVEWELPVVPDSSDSSEKPAKTFHDDHVGAHVKADEAARLRQGDDRGAIERPRDILARHEKIEEAGAFRPAQQEDELARRARLLQQDVPQSAQAPVKKRRSRGDGEEQLSKIEQRLQTLMEDMNTALSEFEQLCANPAALAALGEGRRQQFEMRLVKLEMQLRYRLQMLVAGGVGLTLLADPRATFKRLFDRIKRWPRRVRPGYRPQTDEEFDIFLSWVFEPPRTPVELTLPGF